MTSTSGLLSLSTSIVVTPTGQVMNTVPWSIDQRLGEMGLGGAWITDRLFLIYETLPQGPLLIDVGGDVIQIAPDLFGVPTDPGWPAVFYRAQAFMQPGTQTYHLILSAGGEEHRFPPVRLYHSETGQVEEMPFTHLWSPAFSPDGRWLLLDERPDRAGYGSNALWARPVEPPGRQPHFIGEGIALWSPGWTEVTFGLNNTFSVVTFPEGLQRQSGQVRVGYSLYPREWSPDGRWIAFEGYTGRRPEAIFIVEVPGTEGVPRLTSAR